MWKQFKIISNFDLEKPMIWIAVGRQTRIGMERNWLS